MRIGLPRLQTFWPVTRGKLTSAGLVLLAGTLLVACGGDGEDEPGPIARVTQVVVDGASTAGPIATQETAPTAVVATEPPTVVPTPTPRTYIVQAGDNLTAICRAQVPEVPDEACVTQTVALNGLANASQIVVGQELLLPAASGEPEPALPTGAASGGGGGGAGGGGAAAGPGTGVAPGAGAGYSGSAFVSRVIDGDTIEVDLGGPVIVRLAGIDTPEGLAQPPVCYGAEASAYTRQLAEGQTVVLERDVSDTDNAGRLLRYVFLPNGALLNELLLRDGYAQVVVSPPDIRYLSQFLAAAKSARDAGQGIWSAC